METDSSFESVRYLLYSEAVTLHIMLMRRLGEANFGVADRPLVESALARPRHAAALENADLVRQAATLCFGLIKNHPWVGGNKRTATILVDRFLYRNGIELRASVLISYTWRLQLKQIDGVLMSWNTGIAGVALRSIEMPQHRISYVPQ